MKHTRQLKIQWQFDGMLSMNTMLMENNSKLIHTIVMTNVYNPKLLRHGDLLLKTVKDIPEKAVNLGSDTLQEGEVTGHRHRLKGDFDIVQTFSSIGQKGHKYVNAKSELELVHEEHNTIKIPIGKYVLFQEREFDLFDELYKEVLD